MTKESNQAAAEVTLLLVKMVGQPCTRREVGQWKSLSLGFGEEAERTGIPRSRAYRAWEFGTYRGAWRIIQNGTVLCGSRDTEDIQEMNQVLANISLGRFSSLRQLSELDLRVELDNGVVVDFLTVNSDDDESFHVSCPGSLWVNFSATAGWTISPSDKPSTGESP